MFKEVTKAHVLSGISILLSFIAILFGNNFYEKWQKAELYYSLNEVKLEYPQKIISRLPSCSKDTVYGFYQHIQIMNVKEKPATKLNLLIKPNGSVKDFKVYSIEDTLVSKMENGTMKIKVERLVKGAEITCRLWFNTKPGTLSIQYIDDNGFNTLQEISKLDDTNYFAIAGLVSLSLTILWLLYWYFIAPVFNNRKELRLQNIDLQQKYDAASDELEQLRSSKAEFEKEELSDFFRKLLSNSGKNVKK